MIKNMSMISQWCQFKNVDFILIEIIYGFILMGGFRGFHLIKFLIFLEIIKVQKKN